MQSPFIYTVKNRCLFDPVPNPIQYMKNLLVLFSVFALSNSCLFAQENTSAKIILFRSSSPIARSVVYKVHLNDSQFVRLMNRSTFPFEIPAGEYTFRADNKLKLKAESGKTYYIRLIPIMGFWSTTGELMVVDSQSASTYIATNQLKDLRKPLIRPLNRIGVGAIFGPGLENIFIGKTGDNDDITMSFGGGGGVKAYVGREISKHLDLSGAFLYQSSSLIPNVKNASMKFSRMGASFTAAYIIPIQGGYYQRLKLGIGPDMYLKNVLAFDLSQVDSGKKDTWQYKKETGFHVNALYEANLGDHFSFVYGLEYSYVKFAFQSGTSLIPTISGPLNTPNGTSINFLFGLNVHF